MAVSSLRAAPRLLETAVFLSIYIFHVPYSLLFRVRFLLVWCCVLVLDRMSVLGLPNSIRNKKTNNKNSTSTRYVASCCLRRMYWVSYFSNRNGNVGLCSFFTVALPAELSAHLAQLVVQSNKTMILGRWFRVSIARLTVISSILAVV